MRPGPPPVWHAPLLPEDAGLVLDVSGLSLKFGGVTALADISFQMFQGEILAVIGPNGAGKTSVLNSINGFYRPESGSIKFKNEEILGMKTHHIARRGIARVFQGLQTYAGMTTLDNLLTGRHLALEYGTIAAYFYFWSSARQQEMASRRVVEEVIEFLEIEKIRKEYVGDLPYGLRKRVDFGRALAMEPELLLLDEPMAGMNLEEKEDMARFILDVSEEKGTTMILVEHDMGVVMDIATRIVCLDFGHRIAEGTPEEVRSNPAVVAAYLGEEV